MKSFCIALTGLLFFAFTTSNPLVGTWERVNAASGTHVITFKTDSSFDMLVDGQHRLSGTYQLRDSIFTINDPACPDMPGTYKLTFFGDGDSCRFEAVNDPCAARHQKANGAIMARVKKIKL